MRCVEPGALRDTGITSSVASISPERLLRVSLLQILFSVRCKRQRMEKMQYHLLFRRFLGLGVDDPVWMPTVFSKKRDRPLTTEMSRKVMAAILAHREVAPLLSDNHFSVEGTLVKAWTSIKSFQPTAEDTPPDEDPGGPPGPEATAKVHPEQTQTEIDPMIRQPSATQSRQTVPWVLKAEGHYSRSRIRSV